MGFKASISLLISLSFISCGNFIGFQNRDNIDTGDLARFYLYMSSQELQELSDSMVSGRFAHTKIDDQRATVSFIQESGRVRIRGNSSRYRAKKSYTLEVVESTGTIRYALDAGASDVWIEYAMAMEAYNLIGIHSPLFNPIALFINDEYQGYYNIVPLYNNSLNSSGMYNDKSGSLFKADFEFPAEKGDVHSQSEKKFPEDDDFSLYDRLLVNAANMNSIDWIAWIETPGVADFDGIARYTVVNDYFGFLDTGKVNHYIYFYSEGFTYLPWDSDAGISMRELGGNNLILNRMFESSKFRSLYSSYLKEYFLETGDGSLPNYLEEVSSYIDTLYSLLLTAADTEPYSSLDALENEYNNLIAFITNRSDNIKNENPDWDL